MGNHRNNKINKISWQIIQTVEKSLGEQPRILYPEIYFENIQHYT